MNMAKRVYTTVLAVIMALCLGACALPFGPGEIENKVQRNQTEDSDKKTIAEQIYIVGELIDDGEYDTALEKIASLYLKDITPYQKKQLDDLKDAAEAAGSAKDDSSNYVSSNTNVVATYYVVNCREWITLRSTPSTSASSLAHIPLGQAVGFIENAGNGFYKINYDGKVGYGLAAYLSSEKLSTTSDSTSGDRLAQVVNCEEWITLRSTPSTSAASLDHIPLGAYVTYISTAENGFYYIEYNGQRGYALQSYLALQ